MKLSRDELVESLKSHLAACPLLEQPITARGTTLMSGLINLILMMRAGQVLAINRGIVERIIEELDK